MISTISAKEALIELVPEFERASVYGATAFPQLTQREVAQAFVSFLRSDAARTVLRKKGLEPT